MIRERQDRLLESSLTLIEPDASFHKASCTANSRTTKISTGGRRGIYNGWDGKTIHLMRRLGGFERLKRAHLEILLHIHDTHISYQSHRMQEDRRMELCMHSTTA